MRLYLKLIVLTVICIICVLLGGCSSLTAQEQYEKRYYGNYCHYSIMGVDRSTIHHWGQLCARARELGYK